MSSRRPLAIAAALSAFAVACGKGETTPDLQNESPVPPAAADALQPVVVTETVPNDSDDPAIWIDATDASKSLVIGTDKGDSTGGLFVFTLDGKIDRMRSAQPLRRMNNVDLVTGVKLGVATVDLAVATERGAMALRVYRLPDMAAVDGGGIPVFEGDKGRAPMGVALYKRPSDGALFAIVGGKSGPAEGYLWQYRLVDAGNGTVRGEKVRAFGRYSGTKEIEAIAVDARLGYVYYADETVGIRKYHADPDHPDAAKELALFATSGYVQDHEGMAIYPTSDSTGWLLSSDQQGRRLQLFRREGDSGNPHAHTSVATIPVMAIETDGLDVTPANLGPTFPEGMLVMMSTDKTFHFYDWRDVKKRLPAK